MLKDKEDLVFQPNVNASNKKKKDIKQRTVDEFIRDQKNFYDEKQKRLVFYFLLILCVQHE